MSNRRIRLTSEGHLALGIMLVIVIYAALFFLLDSAYPAAYTENDKNQLALWFVGWLISVFFSAVFIIPIATEWKEPLVFENYMWRNWFSALVFIFMPLEVILVFSVNWLGIRLFEIVER